MSQWIMLDFECPTHGVFEKLCDKRDGTANTRCMVDVKTSERGAHGIYESRSCLIRSPRIECYAVRGRVKAAEMMRGKSEPRPPNVLDTTPLAEGVPYETWAENESARLSKVLDGE